MTAKIANSDPKMRNAHRCCANCWSTVRMLEHRQIRIERAHFFAEQRGEAGGVALRADQQRRRRRRLRREAAGRPPDRAPPPWRNAGGCWARRRRWSPMRRRDQAAPRRRRRSLMRRPIGSSPPKCIAANRWLTMTASWPAVPSTLSNSRPRTSCAPSVSKYRGPIETRVTIGGCWPAGSGRPSTSSCRV